ncbi:MAG: carboxypeptidase regulatory-like domain-containing protein [Candidatus Brockarchaeota archaeon]|nr:carboxypeptidase regulatory-like domain-containing protein [Candidatus Brockarchaeota archaeon]
MGVKRSCRIVILAASIFPLLIIMLSWNITILKSAFNPSNTHWRHPEKASGYIVDGRGENIVAFLSADEDNEVLFASLDNGTDYSMIEPCEKDFKGPVGYVLVFNSFTDEVQYRYIYLGIVPEGSNADCSPSQSKKFEVGIGDIVLFFTDSEGRPLENVHVVFDEWGIEGYTDKSGSLRLEKMPRISYRITAEWVSKYGSRAFTRAFVKGDYIITMPVYDVTLQLLTSKTSPVANANVWLGNLYLGVTDGEGRILVTQVPAGSYVVSAKWLGSDLILQGVNVTTSGEIVLTPSNVHSLTIMVRGAMGQALEGASVTVWKDGAELLRRITDKSGSVEIELPDGEYVIEASFDQFQKKKSVTLTTDSFERIDLDVFVKVLGVSMTLSQTILSVLGIILMIVLLAVIIHEYHIYRRKKLPQLFIVRKI